MYILLKTDTKHGETTTTYINTDNVAKIEVIEQDKMICYKFISISDIKIGRLLVNIDDAEQISMMTALLTNEHAV